jgi:hypothetical protein
MRGFEIEDLGCEVNDRFGYVCEDYPAFYCWILLVVVLHFQPIKLKCSALALLQYSLIMNILDTCSNVLRSRNCSLTGTFILFGDETKAVE